MNLDLEFDIRLPLLYEVLSDPLLNFDVNARSERLPAQGGQTRGCGRVVGL